MACVSSFSEKLIHVFPAMGTWTDSYPMNDTESVPFAGAEMENSPLILVVVQTEVPSMSTVAPEIGCPLLSATAPEICLFWASDHELAAKTAIMSSTNFLIERNLSE